MTAIDLSSYFGLAAMTLLTLNILIGLVMSVKYNPVRNWPHRRINTFTIHNWTAYVALATAAIHPVIILFSSTYGTAALFFAHGILSDPKLKDSPIDFLDGEKVLRRAMPADRDSGGCPSSALAAATTPSARAPAETGRR